MRFSMLFLVFVGLASLQMFNCSTLYEIVSNEELSESGEPLESSSSLTSSEGWESSNLASPVVGSMWNQQQDLPLKVEESNLQVPFTLSGKMLKPRLEKLEKLSPLAEVRQKQFEGEKSRVQNIPLHEMPLEYLPERKLQDIHRDSKQTETLSVLRIPSKEVLQAKAEYLPTITNMEYHPEKQLFKQISHQNIIVDRRFVQPIVKEQQYEIPVYQKIITQPVFQKRHFTQPIVEQKTFIQPIITPQLHKAPSYQRRMITLREVAKPKKELTQETLPVKIIQINKSQQAQVLPKQSMTFNQTNVQETESVE